MTSVMIFVIKHWRYLAGAAVLAFAGLMVHAYGRSRYNAGAASVQAKWDTAKAEQAQTLKATEEEARKREAELRTSVEKLDHELQTEKARHAAAARVTDGRLREYRVALRTARAGASAAGGTGGPFAAIASECPGALAEMDQYARELAFRAVGLQRYVSTVDYGR